MPKTTVTPEGKTVVIATRRGHPNKCSTTCKGVYRFQGELYCGYFNDHFAEDRHKLCIANEGSKGHEETTRDA